jgi:hypothetical protein
VESLCLLHLQQAKLQAPEPISIENLLRSKVETNCNIMASCMCLQLANTSHSTTEMGVIAAAVEESKQQHNCLFQPT